MSDEKTKKHYSSVKIASALTLGWVALMALMGIVAIGMVNAGSDGDAVQLSQTLRTVFFV